MIVLSFFKKHFFLFLEGARLKTLSAVLIPILMSSALAFHQTGMFRKDIFIFTILSALFLQIATNFFNEALDFQEGFDNSLRQGPLRSIQRGKSNFFLVLFYGICSCIFTILFALPLIFQGGWPIMILGTVSLLLSYLYTGSSFSLLKKGLSEVCCFLFFGFATVLGTYYLQTLKLDISLIYLSIQCGFWSLSLLLINHLRDKEEDSLLGRKHFVTIYGHTNSLFFLCIIQVFIYLLCFFWLKKGLFSGALTFFLSPLSATLLYFLCTRPPSKKYNLYLSLCSLLYILFGLSWILALFI